jgi:hypothetical protein
MPRISDNPTHVGQYRGLRNFTRIAAVRAPSAPPGQSDGLRLNAWLQRFRFR